MMDRKEVTMKAQRGRERGVYRFGSGFRGVHIYIYIRVMVGDCNTIIYSGVATFLFFVPT